MALSGRAFADGLGLLPAADSIERTVELGVSVLSTGFRHPKGTSGSE